MNLSNENIVHIEKDGIQYLQFKRLLEYENKLKHCFTLKPLNFREKTKDADDYKKICNSLCINWENIISPKQTHTDIVKRVNNNSVNSDFSDVDGLITNEKNKALSLKFADCTSFLLYDPEKNVIGDIHSGWRGTVKKIGKNAIEKMEQEFGCNPKDIICCIGPTIRKCHFIVEDDTKNEFIKSFNNQDIIENIGIIDGKQKYKIDAVTANINMLKECGLKEQNIIDSGICTVCYHELMHSYRCDKEFSGRNAAIMCLI